MAGGAQPFGGTQGAAALGVGDLLQIVNAAGPIAVAGMGADAGKVAAEAGGDIQQQRVLRAEAAAVLAGVDLDQRARRQAVAGDGVGHHGVVGDHHQPGAGGVQLGDLIQLLRRDADGIKHVGQAVAGEILGLRQGGDGDAVRLMAVGLHAWLGRIGGQRHAGDVDRLGGFHVRPQCHAVAGDGLGHAGDVVLQDLAIEDDAGGRQVGEAHLGP